MYVRSKWRNTDTSTNEKYGLIVQEVLRSRAEGTINHDTGKNAVDGRRNDLADITLFTLLLLVEIATNSLGESASEITHDTNMDGNVIFLRGTMVFPVTLINLCTAQTSLMVSHLVRVKGCHWK